MPQSSAPDSRNHDGFTSVGTDREQVGMGDPQRTAWAGIFRSLGLRFRRDRNHRTGTQPIITLITELETRSMQHSHSK